MKKLFIKYVGLTLFSLVGFSSCSTTYDAYGHPVQSVDPATAIAGATAIGVMAYAIGHNNGKSRHHHRRYHNRYHNSYYNRYHNRYHNNYYNRDYNRDYNCYYGYSGRYDRGYGSGIEYGSGCAW